MNTTPHQTQISFSCLRVSQPIGNFFIASIDSHDLYNISYKDIRRIAQRDVEKYLGIQRPLDQKRVEEIRQYVRTTDACFPTGVILAVDGRCCKYDETTKEMILSRYEDPEDEDQSIPFDKIAKILDGQHRLDGLMGYTGPSFQLNVSIFVDVDLANQATIFSTVNLKQTKVNRSLAYDLLELAKTRSPEKTCHLLAVALDSQVKSPLHQTIKRLGVSTEGRFDEKINQATFVQALLPYLTTNAMLDRDLYMRGLTPTLANADEIRKRIFRNMFIENKDVDIADVLFNFFTAVSERWPTAWRSSGTGSILNRTNGFRGLVRFLAPAYLSLTNPGGIPTKEKFKKIFDKIDYQDTDFNADTFKPGTSGEAKLFATLLEKAGLTNR